jgi:cobalamin biosynthesis protein CbiG
VRLSVLSLGERGGLLAGAIAEELPFHAGEPCSVEERRCGRDGELAGLVAEAFASSDGLVFVMAAGIAARMAAPHLKGKLVDPAIVVLDDEARWSISLLSGHEGGANKLAYLVAAATGAEPVVTTGSETSRKHLLGVGCRKGIAAERVREAVEAVLGEAGIGLGELRCAATARAKAREEGLVSAFRGMEVPLVFLSDERINSYAGPFEPSPAARRHLGLSAVAEPCALIVARHGRLLVPKRRIDGVTVAVAREEA